ncbi:peptidoglycan-binding protein [Streptomyces sp. URMC 128]|uniref:peptidoglycan-binding domain-containing protein n=1 Tax=Streptomyces sp. URMC 128 TaxID=3423404 RepID=UPI003F1B9836
MAEGTPRRRHADGRPSPAANSPAQVSARATDSTPRRIPGRAAEGAPLTPGQTADDAPRPPQTHPTDRRHSDEPAQAAEGAPRQPVTNPGRTPHAEGAAPQPSPADATMPLRPVDPDATTVLPVSPASPGTSGVPVPPASPGGSGPSVPRAASGVPASPATAPLPTPVAPGATEPSVTDLRLFDGTGGPGRGMPETDEFGRRPRRRRRGVLLGVAAGACVAVVAAAGYASGLFSYEAPSRDTALPDDVRASVPDAPASSPASTPPAQSTQVTPSAPAAPPPSPSATRSPSASPSPSASSASPSPSQSATPSAPPASATASGPGKAPPDNSRQTGGPTVLRLGDRGPEVTELQLRLRQLRLYGEDPDGDYDGRLEEAVRNYQWARGIQTDDLGVYDRETRAKLESETKKP